MGVAEREEEDSDVAERPQESNEELEVLNAEARELEARIAENAVELALSKTADLEAKGEVVRYVVSFEEILSKGRGRLAYEQR